MVSWNGATEMDYSTLRPVGDISLATLQASIPQIPAQRVMIIGDSIDQGADTTTAFRKGSWLGLTAAKADWKINYVANAAIGGRSTVQVLANLPTDLLLYRPSIVVLGGGPTNDHGGDIPEATTRANLLEMIKMVKSFGAVPVFRTTPPSDNAGAGVFGTVSARRAAIQRLNAWIRHYAMLNGIYVFDLYSEFVDPTTGGYKTGYSDDGIHPNGTALNAVTTKFAANLPPMFGNIPSLAMNVNDGANLLNGLFLDFTAWGTIVAGTGTRTAVTGDSNIIGNWMRISSPDAGGATVYSSQITVAPGDKLLFSGRYRQDATVRLNLRIVDQAYATVCTPVADGIVAVTKAGGNSFQMEYTVKAGMTGARIQVFADAAVGNVDVAQLSLINLTQLGL